MAQFTDLTELTTPTIDDILCIVDDPSGTPASKKITAQNLQSALNTNWLYVAASGTYLSTTSFRLTGDFTAYAKLGVKIKYNNTTIKYGHVLSSSYSAPYTTINLVANNDYAVANTTISNIYISYANQPDFPDWFSYTPTWTAYSGSPTIGNGSLTGSFSMSNHVLVAHIAAVFGSTTNFASSQIWYFGLAVQPITATLCAANGEQSGGTKWIFQPRTETSTPKIVAGMMNNSAGWVQYNTPFTWANGDKYTADVVCRI
jgi:hypothetical protein